MPASDERNVNRAAGESLAELRAEIDRIDGEIHARLIERGDIIDRLIAVKRTQESGTAFRPAREADMMRRLMQRHRGILPLDTVESIWRVMIATFTYVQAPFSVHADISATEARMRDTARFHFGFTVPLKPEPNAAAVIAAVTAAKGDLGLVPHSDAAAWWLALEPPAAPKIIARLPFIERSDHPASLPVFVLSRPLLADAAANEVECWSVRVSGWNAAARRELGRLAEIVAVPDGSFDGAALLISLPPERKLAELRAALVAAGASIRTEALVGGHATRYTVAPGGVLEVARGRPGASA